MKFTFFALLCLCLGISGCGDEGIENVLDTEAALAAPSVGDAVIEVPTYIQSLLWDEFGTREELVARLIDLEQGDPNVDEEFMADWLIRVISLMDRNREYFTKYINAGGVAVVGHRSVPDEFFVNAKHIILQMTAKHPEIREKLYPRQSGFYMILLGELTTSRELPDGYSQGVSGGKCLINYCWSTVGYWRGMQTFVHEFAHAMHRSIKKIDETFQARLEEAYATAKATGKWRQVDRHIIDGEIIEIDAGVGYIMNNPSEYWAEGVKYWYYRELYKERSATQEAFAKHDPLLYTLLSEWLHEGSFDERY